MTSPNLKDSIVDIETPMPLYLLNSTRPPFDFKESDLIGLIEKLPRVLEKRLTKLK